MRNLYGICGIYILMSLCPPRFVGVDHLGEGMYILTPELGHRAERVAAMLVSTVSKREIPSHEVWEYMRISNAHLLDMGKKWKEYVRISVKN